MHDYYIKYITGPCGQMGHPEDNGNLVEFAAGQEGSCNRFKECDRFFIYETGHKTKNKVGAKAIYAQGIIADDQSSFLRLYPGTGFSVGGRHPYAAKVVLQKRVDPLNGVSLKKIREITGVGMMQRKGGLLKITKEQFDALSLELEKCLRK